MFIEASLELETALIIVADIVALFISLLISYFLREWFLYLFIRRSERKYPAPGSSRKNKTVRR